MTDSLLCLRLLDPCPRALDDWKPAAAADHENQDEHKPQSVEEDVALTDARGAREVELVAKGRCPPEPVEIRQGDVLRV